MRRSAAVAALAIVLAGPAAAHAPAVVRVARPAEGARVTGDTVEVVLVGEGGDSAATFRLDLDGQPVDATGKIGGLFSTLAVRPGTQLRLEVPAGAGEHTLTLLPNANPDGAQQPPVVRRFTVVEGGPGLNVLGMVLIGAVVVVAVSVAVAAPLAARRAAARGAPAGRAGARSGRSTRSRAAPPRSTRKRGR